MNLLLIKRFLGLLLFVSLSYYLFGQTLAYREFTIQDGLMQSQVDRCFLDSRGYLWIGTRGGFSCFNGETIRNHNGPSDIMGTKVNSFAEDTSGNIYFLNQYGIFRFNGVEFTQLLSSNTKYRSMHIDQGNKLWIVKSYSGIYNKPGIEVYDLNHDCKRIYPEIVKHKRIDSLFYGPRLLDHGNSKSLLGASLKNHWKLIEQHSDSTRNLQWKQAMQHFLKFSCSPQNPDNCDIDIDSLFIGPHFDSIELNKIFGSPYINFDPKSRKKLYHINQKSDRLVVLDLQKSKTTNYKLKTKEFFYRYYLDPFDRIWAGTETGLLQVYPPFTLEYNEPFLDICWNIAQVSPDSIFFATVRDEMYLWTPNDGFKSLDLNCTTNKVTFYMGNHRFKDGKIAIASGRGLILFNNQLDCIYLEEKAEIGISQTIQQISLDQKRNQLVTALFGGIGIYNIHPDKVSFSKRLNFQNSEFENSFSNDVFIDKDGKYWVGHEKGLSIYNPSTKSWKDYNIKDGNFPVGDVATLYRDKYGTIWMGSAQGLVVGNEENGFHRIDDPLIFGVVNVIDSFDQEHIILGGSFGICIMDLNAWHEQGKLRGKIFNQSNGFMAGEPAENAIYRMLDGSLMVGTQSYPVQIFPDKMDLDVRPLNTRILSINDSLLPFEYNKQFTLPYKTGEVRIDFEAIGMYRPGPTRYAYRINDQKWSPWQEETYVQLDELGSGTHSFALKAQTPGIDPERYPITTFSFSTSVPIWMEPYFAEILGGLLIASLLFLTILGFLNYRQQRRNLRHAVAIDYLRIQSLQSQMNPHFVFNVLGTLQNMVLKADTKKANQQLVKLSTLIRRFLESTVQSNLDRGQATIKEQSLEQEIELLELYIQFEQLQHDNPFDYTLKVDTNLNSSNINLPPMLIQPFVENAIKHGLMYREDKGHLWINFTLDHHCLICTIEDNGVGRAQAQKIQNQSLRIYKSYGTQLVEERIELLNKMNYHINYFINDRPGGGTIVKLKISI